MITQVTLNDLPIKKLVISFDLHISTFAILTFQIPDVLQSEVLMLFYCDKFASLIIEMIC